MGFFLGTETDAPAGAKVDYQAKHLTTHGLIFGMTGSGKTGLALGVLEEAQRARIPIIAIDPKGDLANLALAWPDLSPKYFANWLDLANLDGRSPLDVAEQQANVWRNGLAKDGLGEAEIGAMRQAANLTIYTPGSTSGIPVSLLDRFEPPPGYAVLPEEDKSELVGGIVGALLSLVKIDADPLQSKEFILLANIMSESWSRGETLDLPKLVQLVSAPPFSRLGVFELDEFFPPKKRRDFAMQLNGLIASPSFQAWLTGVPLDVDRLLRKDPGGPSRTSIFSIAHLDDSERMSFVALLLDRVIAWMRAQPGTGELRAIIYMDEVFGYLPPHPLNPPSKRPLLTLLKQARAYGVGVLLATQNPVDIDYKALTNAGTWMIGKLQTDQDKERILDGLMGAQTAQVEVSRSDVSRKISALEGRQFLLQNAHDGRQRTFKTRFCMSYLRGPLTRQEIGKLRELDFYNVPEVAGLNVRYSGPARAAPKAPNSEVVGEVVETSSGRAPQPAPRPGPSVEPRRDSGFGSSSATRDAGPADFGVPAGVRGLETRYLPSQLLLRAEVRQALGIDQIYAQGPLTLRPALFGDAKISYQIDQWGELTTGTVARLAWPLSETPGAINWRVVDGALRASDLTESAPGSGVPTALPSWLQSPADRERAKDLFVRQVVGTQHITVPVCAPLMRIGEPGEALEAFRSRLAKLLGQAADGALGKAGNSRDQQSAMFDKQLAEMKALLAMDMNELAFLRERGDADALRRANDRAKLRMERYRELQATRAKFVDLAQRDMADIEFSALDRLASCELRDIKLSPKGVRLGFFGLVWIPSR